MEDHQALPRQVPLAIDPSASSAAHAPPIELFRCPFPIYVDASRRLYHLMGMTKLSNDFGPSKDRAAYHQHAVPRQVVSAIGVRACVTERSRCTDGWSVTWGV